jgi:hypothetical protein
MYSLILNDRNESVDVARVSPSRSPRRKNNAEPDKRPVTMEELLVSSLAQTDALAKLLIEKGLITREEFMQKVIRGAGERIKGFSIQFDSEAPAT